MKTDNTIRLGRIMRLITIAALSWIIVVAWGGTLYANADSPQVNKHSRQEIINLVRSTSGSSGETEYAIRPVTNRVRGKLSTKTQQDAIATLNRIRYVAGLDPVTFDETYGEYAQAGAFVDMSIGKMTHFPENEASKPSEMSQEDWDLGCKGAGSCNLVSGCYSVSSAVFTWIRDPGTSNASTLGHRRWCLNPEMGKTGFGLAGGYGAMYCFDTSGTGTQKNVAWPAENMPLEYFSSSAAWSLSTGRKVNKSNITVTLVRQKDGKTWTFNGSQAGSSSNTMSVAVSNGNYGQIGCIIFRPYEVNQYNDGDVFSVTISEKGYEDISYNVNFFAAIPLTKVSFYESQLYLSVGETDEVYLEGEPYSSGDPIDTSKVRYHSSNTAVVTVDNSGKVKGISPGRATITGEYKGLKATMTVVVDNFSDYDDESFWTVKKLPTVKITKPKASKKAITVKWKKVSKKNRKKISGIEIQVATDKGFKNIVKTTTAGKKKTSKKIKGLKSKKTYYVRIRAYKNSGGIKQVSAWKAKKVKVK